MIGKEAKADSAKMKYRPLCLLSVMGEAFRLNVYKEKMMRVQRCMLIRVCGAYRTVSNEVLSVVAAIVLIYLLVESAHGRRRRKHQGNMKARIMKKKKRFVSGNRDGM